MIEEARLSFYFAAQEIERKLSVSRGKAQTTLRKLCAGGEVRSWKQPHINGQEQGPPERIEPSEWRHREIDLMTDDDGCQYFVDVSVVDLEGQLRTPERSDRDAAIVKRLKAGRPGKNVRWKVWCDNIRKDCNKSSSDRGFSDERIEEVTKKLGHFG